MTCIATDGKSMAADGYSRDGGGMILGDLTKVRRLKDGRIVGLAGTPFDFHPLCDWLESGGDVPEFEEDFDALVLMPDGQIRSYNRKGKWTVDFAPSAVGSGMDVAIGAMEHGASPREAVEIACRRHSTCGGTIVVEAL